jgi:amino acid adenylation domain-containing protein
MTHLIESDGHGSLVDVVRFWATVQPDTRVLSFRTYVGNDVEDVHLSFGELDQRAHSIGARLQELNLDGDRALFLFPPGLDFVTAFVGCLSAGVVAVPTALPRPSRPMERLRAILADARPRVVLTTAALAAEQARWVAQAPELAEIPWLATDEIGEDYAQRWRDPRLAAETLAFLQYTSGSTDEPKGVMVSHGNLIHNLAAIGRSFRATRESRGVFWLPLYHDMGLIGGLLQTIYCGGASLLFSPVAFLQEPIRWIEAISQTEATISGAPDFAYDLCARKMTPQQRVGLDLSRWAVAFNGAEPVRAATLDQFTEAFGPCGFRREAFLPCYGLAEATLLVSGQSQMASPTIVEIDSAALEQNCVKPASADVQRTHTFVGCGAAVEGQEVVIVDPETRQRRGESEVGEIWVTGPSTARGYWNRPDETEATFRAVSPESFGRPFLRTGDLGFLNRGELFITGRLKDMIIIRGRNLYPQDLEATIRRSHPLLRADGCAAFSIDVNGRERLVTACEVERRAKPAQHGEIIAAIRQAIALEHEIEVDSVLLLKQASIPKTTSGKIRRHACRTGYLERTLDLVGASDRICQDHSAVSVEPAEKTKRPEPPSSGAKTQGEIQAWLTSRVAAMLGVEPAAIEPDRPLSQSGLGSLRTISLAGELQWWLGRPLDATFFFRDRTPAQFAAELSGVERFREGEPPGEPILLPARTEPRPPEGSHAASPVTAREPSLGSGKHPLSWGQQSLWSLHQFNPQSAAYNVAGAVRIKGALDVAVLRSAFQAISDRHAALRARFPAADGYPVQQIDSSVGVDFRVEDVCDQSDSEVSRRLLAEARRPFDLANGPVFRVRLLTQPPRDPILLLVFHHIVIDFWSVAIVIDEVGQIYSALRAGGRYEFSPPARQAPDFARWQSALLAGPDGNRLWEYWRSKLGGALPVLDIPTDRPRPAAPTDRGATRTLHLDRNLTKRLAALGKDRGASVYVTLLAALHVLLHRYTGQDDLIVGSPVTGRTQPEFADVVGYLVNTLPLRGNLSGNPPFAVFLDRVRRTVLEGLEHQDYPLALLVDRLGLPRDRSCTPLFQVMFVFQQAQRLQAAGLTPFALRDTGPRMKFADLTFESLALDLGAAQFDLTLAAAEIEDRLELALEYNVDLVDAATIDRLLDHFRTLLESIVDEPESPIASLKLVSAAERELLLSTWATHPAAPPSAETVTQLFEAQVSRNPHSPALIFADQHVTYGTLNARADRLAERLAKLGVGPESKVGLSLPRSIEMMVGIFGILKAGGAYVPLDPDYPSERLEFLLADAQIDILVTLERLRGRFANCVGRVVALDSTLGTGADGATLGVTSGTVSSRPARGENLAYVIYTSGSTGAPKGVMITHRNLAYSTHARLDYYDKPAQRFLLLSSVALDSSVAGIFGTLCQGGTLVLPPPGAERDPAELGRLIADHHVSHLLCVPSLYEVLLTEVGGRRLRHLRVAIVAGEPCPRAVVDHHFTALPQTALVNEYGPTEATVWCSAHRCEPGEKRAIVPIGRPIPHARLYVLEPSGEPAPVGVVGELYVGGPGVARGYLGRPEVTAERFLPDRFDPAAAGQLYRTGDRARWVEGGILEFHGRGDDQVKIRGHRIQLCEVEAALVGHPAVTEAAVVAREAACGAIQLVAYVVMADRNAAGIPSRTQWRRWARSRLPEPMVPATFIVIDRLPRLQSGKVDRKALPLPDSHRSASSATSRTPRNSVEKRLAHIAADVLRLKQIDVDEDLFDLGLDSISGIQIAARAKEAGLDVSPAQLFQYTTIAELAEHTAASSEEAAKSPIVESRQSTRRGKSTRAVAVSGKKAIRRRLMAPYKPDVPFFGLLTPPFPQSAPATELSPSGYKPDAQASEFPITRDRPPEPAEPTSISTVIESFGVYLPPKTVSTAEIVQGCRLPLDFPLERMTGIRSRRMAGESEFAIDLAEKAVVDCFARSALKPQDIDLLICCNISRCDGPGMQFTYEPTTAARLQGRFGLEHATAFDISNACAGTFTAITIADAFLATGAARRALVVSGEYITHLTRTAQQVITDFLDPRVACLTLGDSGVAILLKRAEVSGVGFQELDLFTLGKYSDLCVAKASERSHGGAIMLTDSIQGAAVAIQQAVRHALLTLKRRGWPADSLDQIIMHQTSETTLDGAVGQINRAIGRTVCDRRNTVYDLVERGNTATNSHFVALRDSIDAGLIKPGSRVLFGISGSGQTIGTALYTFDDLPERMKMPRNENGRPGTQPPSPPRGEGARRAGEGPSLIPSPPWGERARRAGEGADTVAPRIRIESLGTFRHDQTAPRDSFKLVSQAAERCLSVSHYRRDEVGLIIHSGVYRSDFLSEPAVAAITAGALGINHDSDAAAGSKQTLAFDLMNSGAGTLNACHVATQVIRARKAAIALVVAAEIENNAGLGPEHQLGLLEMGSALLLEPTTGPEGFSRFVFKSFPAQGDDRVAHTVVRDGASALYHEQSPGHEQHLIEAIQSAVAELLTLERLSIEDIARVFPPHRSRSFVAELAQALGLPLARFVVLPDEDRDYFTSSLAASLEAARAGGLIRSGDIGLLIAAGAGVQVGCATYRF